MREKIQLVAAIAILLYACFDTPRENPLLFWITVILCTAIIVIRIWLFIREKRK